MKTSHLVLATAMVAIACDSAMAEASKKTATRQENIASTQPAPTADYAQKIAEMQKSIDRLRADIEKIRTERDELQARLQQSDREVANRMLLTTN